MNRKENAVAITNLHKSYYNIINGKEKEIKVLNNINLNIRKGEFISIFGPNACGKTTFLNIVAGLVEPDQGSVAVFGKSAKEAKTGYIFQNYRDSLFPWKKNIDNIAFPLKLQGLKKQKRHEKALSLMDSLGIELPYRGYPYQLSGGQQQLLSIARSIIYHPDILVFDEPFSALDYQTRLAIQNIFLQIWRKTKNTVLFVSHEIDEAIYLADRLILFDERPTSIIQEFNITLKRPREHSMLKTDEFFYLKRNVLEKFKGVIRI